MFHMAHDGSSARPYTLSASVHHSTLAPASVDDTLSKKEDVEGRRISNGTDEEKTDIVIKKKISQADSKRSIESSVSEMATL